MRKNSDELVKINDNLNWPYVPDPPFRILIIGGLGSCRTNVLLNLIKHQRTDIDKMSKIHLNQSINYLLTKRKSSNQNIKKFKSIH